MKAWRLSRGLRSVGCGEVVRPPGARRGSCPPRGCASSAASVLPQKERSYWHYLRRQILKAPEPPYSRVCQVGDPVLRALAAPLEPGRLSSAEVQRLIRTLVLVMRKERCFGLSAPQLGVPLQVFVAECPETLLPEFAPDLRRALQLAPFPLRVFVNPAMRVLDSRLLSCPEGCGSIRGFSASVARHRAVQVSGLNEAGEAVTWEARGLAARVVQHEMDHLQGVLYIDKMDSSSFANLHWAEVND